jgi:hypothetical protein
MVPILSCLQIKKGREMITNTIVNQEKAVSILAILKIKSAETRTTLNEHQKQEN